MGNTAGSTWPGGDTVTLAWIVGVPNIPHPRYEGVMMQALTLEVSIGDAVRTFELAPQFGSLFPYYQSACDSKEYELEPGQVAQIVFYEGVASGYVVRRPAPGLLELVTVTYPDGGCAAPTGEPVACPPVYGPPTRIEVPAHVKVAETLLELDAQGTRAPIRCEAS